MCINNNPFLGRIWGNDYICWWWCKVNSLPFLSSIFRNKKSEIPIFDQAIPFLVTSIEMNSKRYVQEYLLLYASGKLPTI